MKLATLSLLSASLATASPTFDKRASGIQGFDISHYQANVDYAGAYNAGARFVMIKVSTCLPYS